MPLLTLKDIDKIAWSWAEFTDPEQITFDHIATAYRIKHNFCKNKPCRRNCRGNPFCLSGLGEARLIDSINNPTDDANTTLSKRTAGSFVGLTNLGATCYVNSLLQLWFHNKTFRDAILSWNPLEDPIEQKNSTLYSGETFIPQSVVGHLQQLFALMFYSKRCCIDPTLFVESLGLDTSTQQDAQEFSKLFISLLENSLRHQSLLHVHNLISDNFKGEYMYVTRCCKCLTQSVSPSMFYELELNVKGHNTLTECLAEFLQEEKLEGANCYSCAVCQAKQEACRFIKLSSLPPVLNLQLLRFVYDREKGQKKKLKSVVQFPETLDMTPFVETDSDKPLLYNLSAVLIHKGTQTYSGHFIAYIKDGVTGTWNTFNDEAVTKSEGKKLKLDEEDAENVKKAKSQRLPKGVQSSTDAYMLVYTAENHNPNAGDVQLSSRLKHYVDCKNKEFDEICEEITASKQVCMDKFKELLKVYNCLVVEDVADLNSIDVLSLDWLTAWLDNKKEVSVQIDNFKIVCPHGQLDPNAVTRAKYVSKLTADFLYDQYGGGPRLRLPAVMCEHCVTNQCLLLRTKAKTLEESKEVANLLKKRMGVDEPGFYVDKYCLKTWRTKVLNLIEGKNSSQGNGMDSPANEDASEPMTEEESLPVSQTSSTQNKLETVKEENTKTQCSLSPRKRKIFKNRYLNSRQRRKQNQSITVPLSEIRDCFVLCQRLQVKLNSPNNSDSDSKSSLLNQCKKLKIKLRRLSFSSKTGKSLNNFRRIAPEMKKEQESDKSGSNKESNEQLPNNSESSQPSINSEKIAGELEDKEESNYIDQNKAFNEAIVCPHGNLCVEESERKLVSVRVWEILKQYFPAAPSFPHDTAPCHQCQNLASKDEVVKQQYYESAVNQKKTLSDLYNLRNRPQLGKTEDAIYILSKEHFHLPWSNFLKSATRQSSGAVVDPPVTLNVDSLLCVHGLMHYSPQYEEDQARLVLISRQEWEFLISFYTADRAVTVQPDLTTDPELCHFCFSTRIEHEEKEKLNYDRARINIRMVPSVTALEELESSDPLPTSKRARIDDDYLSPDFVPPDAKKSSKNAEPQSTSGPADVRRSSRNKKARGQKDVSFIVASTLTLRELKQKITNQMAVAPFDQHLSTLDGKELLGDFNTLASLGILPNSILLLRVDEPKESFDMLEECSLTEPEEGFKGTGLLHAY